LAKVLVEGSKVTCGAVPPDLSSPHQGLLSMKGATRLVVANRKVLTTESVKGATVSDACKNPGNLGGPCTAINLATFSAGTSTRLRVDGVFVVLDSFKANTDRASQVHVVQTSINNSLLAAD
jgi:hypothetical protein